jgi:very-short-patch-repair endonuclease
MRPKRIRTSAPVQQRAKELRQSMTRAERNLWDRLRDRMLAGNKFRRQHPIGAYIVDFYCAEARLVIEVDGGIHLGQVEADASRSRDLEAKGYRVIRFSNEQIETSLETVLSSIKTACQLRTPRPPAGEGPKPFFGVG